MEARGATIESIRANLPTALERAQISATVENQGKKTVVRFDDEDRVIVFEKGAWEVRTNRRSRSGPSVRFLLWATPLVVVAVVSYVAWGFVSAARIAEVVRSGNPATVMAVVDADALRHSLAEQLTQAVMRQNQTLSSMSGIGRSLAGGVAGSVVDSMLSDVLKPENIAALLKGDGTFAGRTKRSDAAPKLPELSDVSSTSWLKLLLSVSFDGLTSFGVTIDHGGEAYTVHFHLNGAAWQLSGVDLPRQVIDGLAQKAQSNNAAD